LNGKEHIDSGREACQVSGV